MHAKSLPTDQERRGEVEEVVMDLETQEILETWPWREEAEKESGPSSGPTPHPAAVALGSVEEIVRFLRQDDVRSRR